MTHADLVQRAVRWLRSRHRCNVVFAEMVTALPVTMDALGFNTRGICVSVECKMSRADFHADKRKIAHRVPHYMPGDLRYYLTPPGLLKREDLPDGWGLAECHPARVVVVVEPKRQLRSADDLRTEIMLLTSACRRHQLGVRWRQADAKFDPYHGNGVF